LLCTVDGDDPNLVGCWAILLDGDQVTFISEHDNNASTGTLSKE